MISLKIFNLKEKKGLSLIEALVVLFIIGIITAVALPYFFGFYSGAELKTAGRRIASVLRAAKSYAEAKNVDYQVVFSIPVANKLEMAIYEDPSGLNTKVGKTEKIELSSSVVFSTTFTDNKVTFTPHSTSNGGTVEITNTSKNKEVDVSVCSNTARVSISDIKPPD